MNVKELSAYLERFQPDSEISLIVADPVNRIKYDVDGVCMITDFDGPVFGIELGEADIFDDEAVAAAEQDEKENA